VNELPRPLLVTARPRPRLTFLEGVNSDLATKLCPLLPTPSMRAMAYRFWQQVTLNWVLYRDALSGRARSWLPP